MTTTRYFSVWDFVVFGLSLFFSCAIGLWIALRGMNTKKNATNTLFTAVFIIPVMYRVKSFSLYSYLQERFEYRLLRSYGALLFTLATLLYMAIVLYAPSVALSAVTTVDVWIFIVTVGVVCTAYTSIGGLKAVVWTDAFQTVVMYAGSITLVVKGTIDIGGVSKVLDTAQTYGRLDGWTNFDPNPFQYMTFWTALFGGFFYWLGTWGANQMSLQRYCSTSSIRQAQILALITIPFVIFINFLVYATGLVMFSHFYKCDPLKTGEVKTKDQLSILFMMDVFQKFPGLPGLFLACLFSGTLSTVSSGINSLAAVFLDEFIQPIKSLILKFSPPKEASILANPKFDIWMVKIIGILFGAIAIGLAFLAQYMGGILKALTSGLGALNGPLLGLILLGILVPFANGKGAFVGAIVGNILALWAFIGAQVTKPSRPTLPTFTLACNDTNPLIPEPFPFTLQSYKTTFDDDVERFYYLSYYMFAVLSTVATIIVGSLVSLATGGSKTVDRKPDLCYWTIGRSAEEDIYDQPPSFNIPRGKIYNVRDVELNNKRTTAF